VGSRAELKLSPIEWNGGRERMRDERAEIADAIGTRRSIRRFSGEPVPREVVRELLEAGTRAPSPHNRQPWRFAVLRQLRTKARLARAMGERLRADRGRDGDPAEAIEADVARSRARIEGAPVVLVAALSMRDMDRYVDERRSNAEHLMAVQATAAAVQNLLLLAQARGLGACWMCAPLFCPETVRSALDLPEDWEPQALVALGLAEGPGRERPRLDLSETAIWLEDGED
jgi:F420 biosynthesis protein FbiB-like protein